MNEQKKSALPGITHWRCGHCNRNIPLGEAHFCETLAKNKIAPPDARERRIALLANMAATIKTARSTEMGVPYQGVSAPSGRLVAAYSDVTSVDIAYAIITEVERREKEKA